MSHLRLLDPERDAPALHAIFGDQQSCTYLPKPAVKTVEETFGMLRDWTIGTERTSWAIIDQRDGPALGRVSLIPRDDNVWEVAIMLIPSATGNGLATRATSEALDIAFADFSARRIYADCDPDNAGSIAIFKRLGFTEEGYLREAWTTHIGPRDSIIYGLLARDPRPWTK